MKLLISLLMVLTFSISIFSEEFSFDSFENLTSQWVELRKEISQEKTNWKEEKEKLEMEKELLLKEKKALKDGIFDLEEKKRKIEDERKNLVEKKENIEEKFNSLIPSLKKTENFLIGMKDIIPSPSEPLKKSFLKISKEDIKVPERLRTILSIISEIERVSNSINFSKEILTTKNGEKREMDIVYIGLSYAFAVSKDNKLSAIGRIEKNRWKWEWRKDIAQKVRELIEYYKKEKVPRLIEMPLRIEK